MKEYLISALPAQYLILHLMRTQFDPKSAKPVKNASKVQFPLRGLDMSKCLPVRALLLAVRELHERVRFRSRRNVIRSRTTFTISTRPLSTTAEGVLISAFVCR